MKTVAQVEAEIRKVDQERAALSERLLVLQQELEMARAAERFIDVPPDQQKAFRERVMADRREAEAKRLKEAEEAAAQAQARLDAKKREREETAKAATERIAKPKTKPAAPADGGEG